nr:putative ribonuclease H-like domain-containing protein [Tanacetum cinerariifolium]
MRSAGIRSRMLRRNWLLKRLWISWGPLGHVKERTACLLREDLKAQLQDKGIVISELKKLIEKLRGKSVDTKFEKSSVIRQPNAFKIQRPSILGKPTIFSDSLERKDFSKSKSQLKSNPIEDRVLLNNSQGKKQEVGDHRRNVKFSKNKTSVTACNNSLNAKTSNVNFVCASCGKCVLNDKHDMCVLKSRNGVNSRTKIPIAVPVSTREPKRTVEQFVAKPLRKTVASETTNQKPRNTTRKLYEHVSQACSWWYPKFTPPAYKWKPKTQKENVNPNVSMPLGNISRTANILEPMTSRRSTVSNTPYSFNSFAARRDYPIHRRIWVLVEQILYSITLQDTSSPNPICLMAKATSSQAWLWHRHLSYLNFDTINLLSKNDIVIGLPKLKFVKDHLCSSYEVTNLQCDYLELLRKCECLEKELLKSKMMSKSFKALQKHAINLEIDLQQYLKAQLQDKGIVISELKKLIEKLKGKSVDTKFEKSSVIRQPNAFKSQRPSILGKPIIFSDSLERKDFQSQSHLTAKTLNVNFVCATCGKCVLNEKHDMSVLKSINGVMSRTKMPLAVPVSTREPKCTVKQSVAKPLKKTVASESNQKPRNITRKLYECIKIFLFIVDFRCSKHMTRNLKLLINFVEKFLGTVKFGNDQNEPILGYGDLVQGAVTIKRVYYVEGLNHSLFSVGQFCDADLEVAFRKSTCYIHDLKGNDLLIASINGKRYVLVIIDDYSRYTWTHFLRSKDETPEVLIYFLRLVQRGLHAQVRIVRTDKGTEFLNKNLHAYFASEGILYQMSVARAPKQNGVVERRNRTLVEAARTMLSAVKVSLFFWAEAIATACFTQNHSLVIP